MTEPMESGQFSAKLVSFSFPKMNDTNLVAFMEEC